MEMVRQKSLYLMDELTTDTVGGGHNIIATVYMECGSFYRVDGPDHLKPVGEVAQVAALTASSPRRFAAAIIGHADLTHERAAETLAALAEAGDGRFRGIRHMGATDADPAVMGPLAVTAPTPPLLFASDSFRRGFAELHKMNLSFDAWVMEPQIADVTALALAFPDTPIVLDHVGTPIGIGAYAGRLGERFDLWRAAIRELATCANVSIKLGGLAMPFCALPGTGYASRASSAELAKLWSPYVETCIDAFGTTRAMFESNFPVDSWGADYDVLWNSFKRITKGASADEKANLFEKTAARVYRFN